MGIKIVTTIMYITLILGLIGFINTFSQFSKNGMLNFGTITGIVIGSFFLPVILYFIRKNLIKKDSNNNI